jgi:hypothetical protein
MAETLGADKKAPKKPAKPAKAADNVVQMKPNSTTVATGEPIPNAPPEEQLRKTLLNGVADLRDYDDKIATAMSKVKALRGDRKAVVAKMGAAGLPASLIKEAMEDADNTRTDMAEKEKARDFIRDTFGLARADYLNAFDGMPTGAVEEVDWEARGYTAGVMGADGSPPTECPAGACSQAWLKGHARVMEARALAMAPKSGKKAPKSDEKPATTEVERGAEHPLILTEADFEPDTALEEASTQTLVGGYTDHIASYDRVLVRFGNRQRLLKDVGYLDDGSDEAGVSEIEDVATEAAASFE